jgi:hypothetical protein
MRRKMKLTTPMMSHILAFCRGGAGRRRREIRGVRRGRPVRPPRRPSRPWRDGTARRRGAVRTAGLALPGVSAGAVRPRRRGRMPRCSAATFPHAADTARACAAPPPCPPLSLPPLLAAAAAAATAAAATRQLVGWRRRAPRAAAPYIGHSLSGSVPQLHSLSGSVELMEHGNGAALRASSVCAAKGGGGGGGTAGRDERAPRRAPAARALGSLPAPRAPCRLWRPVMAQTRRGRPARRHPRPTHCDPTPAQPPHRSQPLPAPWARTWRYRLGPS